jgi:3-dehydroquinate synthase class II
MHNGTDTFIDNGTGNLNIRNQQDDGDINFICDDGSGGTTEYFRVDGSSEINIFSKSVRLNDSVQLQIGAGQDLQIYHDGTDSQIKNATGDLKIEVSADDKDIVFRGDDGSGAITTYVQLDGSEVSTKILTQKVIMSNLPTSDPSNAGQLYTDSGVLKVSAG